MISIGLFGHSGDSEVWDDMDEGVFCKLILEKGGCKKQRWIHDRDERDTLKRIENRR